MQGFSNTDCFTPQPFWYLKRGLSGKATDRLEIPEHVPSLSLHGGSNYGFSGSSAITVTMICQLRMYCGLRMKINVWNWSFRWWCHYTAEMCNIQYMGVTSWGWQLWFQHSVTQASLWIKYGRVMKRVYRSILYYSIISSEYSKVFSTSVGLEIG